MTPLVDTNVYLGCWPFRRLPDGEVGELVTKLRAHNVAQAWTGSFEGLFHRDLADVNQKLAHTCRTQGKGLLVPFGSINPTLPDWQEDVRRCHEEHHMPGIRLHPNYHGYRLDDEVFAKLLADAESRNLIVQLVVSMEDERTQHRLSRVPHVDCKPLTGIIKAHPKGRLVVLNAFRALPVRQAADLAAAGQVWFDIAMLEGLGGLARLVDQAGAEHVVFGSYTPQFYFASAQLKLRESQLAGFQIEAISAGNARGLLAS